MKLHLKLPARQRLKLLAQKYVLNNAAILMYHRVDHLDTDIWNLAVSPENFEQQLQVLKKKYTVVCLQQLASDLQQKKRIRKHSIALSFDDGYLDNFMNAKPLLEKYEIPATFFITTGNLGANREFWWDELEHIILSTPQLPPVFSMQINGTPIDMNLEDEQRLTDEMRQRHRTWQASYEEAPTRRGQLFFAVWQQLQPLLFEEQQTWLQQIRTWAGIPRATRPAYSSMSVAQLQQLSANPLFTIGAHTVTHPALLLKFHDPEFQRHEIQKGREQLQKLTAQPVNLFAYPYGNHDHSTVSVAAAEKFTASFTTIPELVTRLSHPHRIGRFEVKNWTGVEFNKQLQRWF